MKVGERVSITDPQRTHEGTVTAVKTDGMVTVKWDSGMTELVHRSELAKLGAPVPVESILDDEDFAVLRDKDDEGGYEEEKRPSFRERLASLWDSRPGR